MNIILVNTIDNYVNVLTSKGMVQGFRKDLGNNKSEIYYGHADVFLGIPYAKPPINQLRFSKPIAVDDYTAGNEYYNATYYRDICPQLNGIYSMSEDCLYLNILSPDASSMFKNPVIVLIHGGTLNTGSAREYDIEGIIRNFVSRKVVVVTIQYRIGMLGFFTTFTDDFPPNLGMLDQVEALKWISNEIQNFGGNPYQITLIGHSAGAASVLAHTYSPLSKGLFQQAIIESPLPSMDYIFGNKTINEIRSLQICNFTFPENKNNFTALKECLMNANFSDFLPYEENNFFDWKILTDGYFLPESLEKLYINRQKIPVIYGSTKDEWSYFDIQMMKNNVTSIDNYNQKSFENDFRSYMSFYEEHTDDVLLSAKSVYIPSNPKDDDHIGWLKAQSNVFTGAGFKSIIARDIERFLSINNSNIYLYEFSYLSDLISPNSLDQWKPVPHSAENPFVWMQKKYWLDQNKTITTNDYEMADFFGETWTNFAKKAYDGFNPNWQPVLNGKNLRYFEIGNQQSMISEYSLLDRMFWNFIIPKFVEGWNEEKGNQSSSSPTFTSASVSTSTEPISASTTTGTNTTKNVSSETTTPTTATNDSSSETEETTTNPGGGSSQEATVTISYIITTLFFAKFIAD